MQQLRESCRRLFALWERSNLGTFALLLTVLSSVTVACQSVTPAPPASPVAPTLPAAPPRATSASYDSRASYHFLLGYQAELDQETELAIKEYQLALQTDSSSNYLKARLAVLYFTAGDVPAAVRFADEVADA